MYRDEAGVHTNIKTLEQNGDFRSDECIELLKEADIVCTNPPFSLFREYVAQLIEYNKKFLIIGNKNAIACKEIFPYIKTNTIRASFTPFSGGLWFTVPEGNGKDKYNKIVDGVFLVNVPAIWLTNLDIQKHHEKLILWKEFTKNEFPVYDNYPDVIEVSKVQNIPFNYDGKMGVPITFLDKYCIDQFDILDKISDGTINGKHLYVRIIIKRKDTV